MHAADSAGERLTTLDWIGAVVTAFSALDLVVFPVAGGTYAAMFEDFGTSHPLPLLTRLATSVWFPLALATPVVVGLAMGLRPSKPLASRRAWIARAFALGGASVALCVVGVYVPIFALADAVKAL